MTMVNGRDRRWTQWSRTGLMLVGAGLVAMAAGFAGGNGRDGDAATGWGVLAGIGFALVAVGLVKVWIEHHAQVEGDDPGGATKRERLQAQRARMLWVFPLAGMLFLFQATNGAIEILAGRGDRSAYIGVFLPVLYSWVVAMIVMGWDGQSRKNRKFMEDELIVLIRARAMTAASIVLMIGLTVAFGLGLWRADMGVLAIPFALTIGAATAGIRFAWLDREAGRVEDERG